MKSSVAWASGLLTALTWLAAAPASAAPIVIKDLEFNVDGALPSAESDISFYSNPSAGESAFYSVSARSPPAGKVPVRHALAAAYNDPVTLDTWLDETIRDAERRGLPALRPLLESLAAEQRKQHHEESPGGVGLRLLERRHTCSTCPASRPT